MDHKDDWQRYADTLVPLLLEHTAGILLWNFDCQYAAWGMKNSAENMGINWKEAFESEETI